MLDILLPSGRKAPKNWLKETGPLEVLPLAVAGCSDLCLWHATVLHCKQKQMNSETIINLIDIFWGTVLRLWLGLRLRLGRRRWATPLSSARRLRQSLDWLPRRKSDDVGGDDKISWQSRQKHTSKTVKNANFKAATTTRQQQEQQELRQQATTMAIKRTRPGLQTILLRGLITHTHTPQQ